MLPLLPPYPFPLPCLLAVPPSVPLLLQTTTTTTNTTIMTTTYHYLLTTTTTAPAATTEYFCCYCYYCCYSYCYCYCCYCYYYYYYFLLLLLLLLRPLLLLLLRRLLRAPPSRSVFILAGLRRPRPSCQGLKERLNTTKTALASLFRGQAATPPAVRPESSRCAVNTRQTGASKRLCPMPMLLYILPACLLCSASS